MVNFIDIATIWNPVSFSKVSWDFFSTWTKAIDNYSELQQNPENNLAPVPTWTSGLSDTISDVQSGIKTAGIGIWGIVAIALIVLFIIKF